MNSYPLHRPDGTASGVWACGACHRAYAQTTGGTGDRTEVSGGRASNVILVQNWFEQLKRLVPVN